MQLEKQHVACGPGASISEPPCFCDIALQAAEKTPLTVPNTMRHVRHDAARPLLQLVAFAFLVGDLTLQLPDLELHLVAHGLNSAAESCFQTLVIHSVASRVFRMAANF